MKFEAKKFQRLQTSIERSLRVMEPFRTNRIEAMKQYIGSHYSNDGAEDHVPVNLIEIAVDIYQGLLGEGSPSVLINSFRKELGAGAYEFEIAVNQSLHEELLEETLDVFKLDAIFCMGIVKVGLNRAQSVEISEQFFDVGKPFIETVLLEDFVFDTDAKRWDQCDFLGNRFRVSLDDVKKSKLYDKKITSKLSATPLANVNDFGGDERSNTLSGGSDAFDEEYEDKVELWEVWLPRDGLVITLSLEEQIEPLRVIEWTGPKTGPYHFLGFGDVPGNVMPLAPVMIWRDLHDLVNLLYNKLTRQAERQKTVLPVPGPAMKDGDRIVKANDGDAIATTSSTPLREVSYGGIDQTNFAFLLQSKDLFSWITGNLDTLGGLGPMAGTVGQEEIIDANVSRRLKKYRRRYIKAVKGIVRDYAWYLWNDPVSEQPFTKSVPGMPEAQVPFTFSPGKREGNFFDYQFDISPFSMRDMGPGERLQVLERIFQSYILPLAPMLEAQGILVNLEELLKLISRYTNLPEINYILDYAMEQGQQQGPLDRTQQSPFTHRVHERVNRSEATRVGQDQNLIQTLLGNKMQANFPGGS